MTLSFVYWFLMLCSILFTGWWVRGHPEYPWHTGFIPFLLFCLLGWKVFGEPLTK